MTIKKTLLSVTAAVLAASFSSAAIASENYDPKSSNQQQAAMPMNKTVVDTAAANEDFTTLVSAVKAADLAETLSGSGPFTVFAPTNEAFAALPEGTLDDLLKPENKDKLAAILTYHVVPGKVMSSDLAGKQMQAETVNGEALDIDATSGVMIEDAQVVQADIPASNGVIHVIDKVLIPGS